MKSVMQAVEHGFHSRHEIEQETKLVPSKVRAAIWNLTFIGVINRVTDDSGRSRYVLPGTIQGVAKCLCGVRSIFDVR